MKSGILGLKNFFLYSVLFHSVLNATYETQVKQEWVATSLCSAKKRVEPVLPNAIPADLAYWIADIKLNDQGVKIIEFGDGNYSGYKVLDNLYFCGKTWQDTWEYLFSFGLPVWFVGNHMKAPEKISWNTFCKGSNLYSDTLETLQSNKDFLQQVKKGAGGVPKTLLDYQGIIVLKCYKPSRTLLQRFTKQFPNVLILNAKTTSYVRNKQLSDDLFTTPDLKTFRPQALVLPKEHTRTLAQDIVRAMPGVEWFVIKPINSTRGNGIIMTNRQDLQHDLYKVLVKHKNSLPIDNSYTFRPEKPQGYEYWLRDRNSHFLIEEYAESKPTIVNSKPYDATARVIFMMRYEQGRIKIDYLDAYWKRPLVALTEKGTFKEKHISKHAPNFEESQGLLMNAEDFKAVQDSMNKMLPQVYWNLLSNYYSK